jgi:hypothetical protein
MPKMVDYASSLIIGAFMLATITTQEFEFAIRRGKCNFLHKWLKVNSFV